MTMKILYALSFIDLFAIGLLMPLSGVHVLSLGGTRFIIGLLASTHSLLQLVSGPLIGSWSDTKGRKSMLTLTLLGVLLSNVLLAINSLYIYIFSRIIFGCFYQVQILLKALVADNTKPEEHAAILGKMGALSAFAFIGAPIIGGHLMEYENGFYNVSLLLSGSSVCSILLIQLLPNAKPKQDDSKRGSIISKLKMIDWNIFWDLFALKFLVESSCSVYFQTFGLVFMQVFQTSQKELGYIIALFSIAMIASNLLNGTVKEKYYKDDFNCKRRYLHCLLGLAGAFCLLATVPTFWFYVFFLIPFAAFKTLLDTTMMESLLMRTKEDDKGIVMGAFESMLQLAGLATPIICGYISELYGYNTSIGVCVIPLTLAAGLVATFTPKLSKTN